MEEIDLLNHPKCFQQRSNQTNLSSPHFLPESHQIDFLSAVVIMKICEFLSMKTRPKSAAMFVVTEAGILS